MLGDVTPSPLHRIIDISSPDGALIWPSQRPFVTAFVTGDRETTGQEKQIWPISRRF
jgi:hypothetical protein